MACPHTFKFVTLTEEVKAKIAAEKKPRLSDTEVEDIQKTCKSIGLRTELHSKDGKMVLGFANINPGARDIFSKTIPELLSTLGLDLHLEFFF